MSSCRTRPETKSRSFTRPTAAPTGRGPSRSASSPTTPSRGISAPRRFPLRRSTRLALGYFYYPVAACDSSTCDLTVGFVSSTGGGVTWAQARKVAGPFKLAWIAQTDQGPMVGDYISTSFAGGPLAFPVFAIAKPPTSGVFDERAASARFDVTIPTAGKPVRVHRDQVRFRQRVRASAGPLT